MDKEYLEIDFEEFWEAGDFFREELFPETDVEADEKPDREPSFYSDDGTFSIERFLLLGLEEKEEE